MTEQTQESPGKTMSELSPSVPNKDQPTPQHNENQLTQSDHVILLKLSLQPKWQLEWVMAITEMLSSVVREIAANSQFWMLLWQAFAEVPNDAIFWFTI